MMSYELHGSGFDSIPANAVGIVALNNDEPLEYINTTNEGGLVRIGEKTQNRITLTQQQQYYHSIATYLGAIVSADRQTIYWMNSTKPLP